MALFGKKKEEKESTAADTSAVVSESKQKKDAVTQTLAPQHDISSVIIRPRITEKAVLGTDKHIYTFEVHRDASKQDIRAAIKQIYDVTPRKINVVKRNPRHYMSRMRGRKMMERGFKKAYVYLKEGDRIDLV